MLSRRVTILGSTGSIGVSTLDVIAHMRAKHGPDAMPIEALTARDNVDMLAVQAREFRPQIAVIGNPALLNRLAAVSVGHRHCRSRRRQDAIDAAARQSTRHGGDHWCCGACSDPCRRAPGCHDRACQQGMHRRRGRHFREALAQSRAVVIPVDSEHNAAFQVLDFAQSHAVDSVTLTASGGPFREWSRERMALATPEQAVAHPNWSMGAKISVDSATLMNKGLELIEAHFLFALPADKLGVIVHPQSIIHCLVYYSDGSTLAHLSAPDMRTPISYALFWPQRAASPSRRLDLAAIKQLNFEAPDLDRFPCLGVAQDCLRAGGLAPTIMNAANEIAVEAFLNRKIGFLDIARAIAGTLDDGGAAVSNAGDIEGVLAVDRAAREIAGKICDRLAH